MKKKVSLYIHIPFCASKCFYCDFNSYSGLEEKISSYFDALAKEISFHKNKHGELEINTIYIGGGTPSYVESKYIYNLINDLNRKFFVPENAEITIESNPGTITYQKLMAYKAIGINRLSIGVQSMDDTILQKLGRIHNSFEAIKCFEEARKAGFKNINLDLIFGIPGQTLNQWGKTISAIIKMDPEHISAYSLNIEKGTPIYEKIEEGLIEKPDDVIDREMYYIAIERFLKSGYNHYEISNFSKDGYLCNHNITYWKCFPYIGIGAGAHSYFNKTRFNNTPVVEQYINSLISNDFEFENIEKISCKRQMSEYIFLGLRLIEGIDIHDFNKRFNVEIFDLFEDEIKRTVKKQLVEIEEDKIRLTSKGLDYANEVFVEFI